MFCVPLSRRLGCRHDVVVNGKTNSDAAWYYLDPEPAASAIKGRVAFWKGAKIR
jgi:uncharacterized protein (DUF427 family)